MKSLFHSKKGKVKMEEIKTTQEYYNMSTAELLVIRNEYGYIREECKLLDEGLEIVYYDSKEELEADKDNLTAYMQQSKNKDYWYEIKVVLEKINKKIAVVLV
jgi:hypothetical protein